MIREAGFEIDGNPLYEANQASEGFRVPGDGPLLRPEVQRPSASH